MAFVLISAAASPALAIPYLPATDDAIVERLRDHPLDQNDRELRMYRKALRANPGQLTIALAVAQRCIDVARRNGDPRYIGYAEAALAPWWQRVDAPDAVRLLKAIILQSVHQFGPATQELQTLLQHDPANSQAWLTRASIDQVQGDYAQAQDDCRHLQDPASADYRQVCQAELRSLQGAAEAAYRQLEEVRFARPDLAGWLHLAEAELSERRGDAVNADLHYRATLAAQPEAYARGAYADFLLDHGRPAEVVGLLAGSERADALLLRLALAYAALGDPRRDAAVADLQARFDAARLRGDAVHRREEARFALQLRNEPARALALARENWAVQKEPADARLLLMCARAAGQDSAADDVRQFLETHTLADVRLAAFRP